MIPFIADTLKQFVLVHYRGAVIFGIIICCMSQMGEKVSFVSIRKNKMPLLFLFSVYIYFVFAITILSRMGTSITNINLIPLITFQQSKWDRMYFYVNVVLFIPMPFFLYLLYPSFRSFRNSIVFGFLVSVGIELIQFVFQCGWCDIDDVLSNTMGMAVGWIFIRYINRGWHLLWQHF